MELKSGLDRSMNWVGRVSSDVGSGPKTSQRGRDGEPEQMKWKMLPASPVGTNAKAKAKAEADGAVSFMLLLTSLLDSKVN